MDGWDKYRGVCVGGEMSVLCCAWVVVDSAVQVRRDDDWLRELSAVRTGSGKCRADA